MTRIEIELPEATAKAANQAGLLTTDALDRLLTNEIQRQQEAADRPGSISDGVAAADTQPMLREEVEALVKAERAARKHRKKQAIIDASIYSACYLL